MAFSHIIVISTIYETLDVISVWLNSVINPRVLCVSAIPIQWWHLNIETWPSKVGSLQDGIREHTDCRTHPLGKATRYSSLLISNSSPFLLYRWRTQGTSSLNRMMTPHSDDTWRKLPSTWRSEYSWEDQHREKKTKNPRRFAPEDYIIIDDTDSDPSDDDFEDEAGADIMVFHRSKFLDDYHISLVFPHVFSSSWALLR